MLPGKPPELKRASVEVDCPVTGAIWRARTRAAMCAIPVASVQVVLLQEFNTKDHEGPRSGTERFKRSIAASRPLAAGMTIERRTDAQADDPLGYCVEQQNSIFPSCCSVVPRVLRVEFFLLSQAERLRADAVRLSVRQPQPHRRINEAERQYLGTEILTGWSDPILTAAREAKAIYRAAASAWSWCKAARLNANERQKKPMNANRAELLAAARCAPAMGPIRYCASHRRIRVHPFLLAFICVESCCLAS